MRRFWAVTALTLLGLVVVGGPATAKDNNTVDGAQAAMVRFYDMTVKRQWGPLYKGLHPAHKALVTKEAFSECQDSETPSGLTITELKFIDSYKETRTIPSTTTKAKSTALTVKLTVAQGNAKQTGNDTVHVYWVNKRWVFSMDPDRVKTCIEDF